MGAFGWDHEQWRWQYYPDDMPSDWRLAYYANDFESVLVPFNIWSELDLGEIELGLDEGHDTGNHRRVEAHQEAAERDRERDSDCVTHKCSWASLYPRCRCRLVA